MSIYYLYKKALFKKVPQNTYRKALFKKVPQNTFRKGVAKSTFQKSAAKHQPREKVIFAKNRGPGL
jgi:hypothetical protein